MARRPRDQQRSRVYAWERKVAGDTLFETRWPSLEQCASWAEPIWRAERGRYGLPRQESPAIERPAWGQRRALAFASHRITLPRSARNPWTVLHELAHRLCPSDEAHGARFVAVLMGLVSRHLGHDVHLLMASADELGVKYFVRSIGSVPVISISEKVERAITEQGAMTMMDLACWMDVPYKTVWGASLSLVRKRRARILRGKLHLPASAQ